MKNTDQNTSSMKTALTRTSAHVLAGSIAAVLGLIAQPAAHANGTPYYFDVDGDTVGFGTPTGPYNLTLSDGFWSADSAGSSATAGFPDNPGAMMVIGNTATDFDGATFTINFGGDFFWLQGLAVNSTNANITLAGSSLINYYPDDPVTSWHVATGSTLNVTGNYGGIGGLNWGGHAVSFTGGGTLNFVTAVGMNSVGKTMTQNGPVVNMQGSSAAYGNQANYTLTAGTLNFASAAGASAFAGLGGNSGIVTINGGTIDNTSGSAMVLDLKGGYAGQGTINIGGNFTFTGSSSLSFGTTPVALTASSQITVAASTLTVGGGISGGGSSLTKAGAGTLTLAGPNSYTGTTTVSSGKLYLNNTNATSAISVAGAATLGGSGSASVATATVDATGIVEAGFGGTGGLTLSGLTFSDTATVKLGNVGNYTSNAAIHVTTTDGLIASGAAGTVTLALSGAAPASSGTAHLLQYDGTLGGTGFSAFILNTAGVTFGLRPVSFTLTNPAGYVDVDYVADQPVWSGDGDDEWVTSANLTVTPTTNWVVSSNALTQTNFIVGDAPIFDDSATPLVTVAVGINGGNVSPSDVVFSNNTKNYVFSGSDGIAGGATLTKSGTGNVTVGTPNSYTGGTTVTAGSLILSVGGTLGATTGALTVDGSAAIVDLGTTSQTVGAVSLKNGATISNGALAGTSFAVEDGFIDATLDGSGATLTKSTPGAVTVAGPNTYDGGTTVTAGLFAIAGAGTFGATTGALTADGGTAVVDLGATSQTVGAVSLKNGATISNGTLTGTSFAVEGGSINAILDGSGATLTKSTAGTVILSGANTYDGGTTVTAGTIAISGTGTLGATTGALTADGGTAVVDLGATSQTVGAVSLKNGAQIDNGTLTGTSFALESGSIGADLTGSGAALTKTTTGTGTLSGANAYDGGTNVNGGVLALGSSGALGATGTISFGGGRLQFSASNVTDYSARFSASPSQAYALDTNGEDVTVATALTSVGGTLAKSGAGTLTLAAANTHTGTTIVSGGALKLGHNQALQNSTVSAVTGGTLAFATGITSPTLGGLAGAGNITLTTDGAEDVTLTVGGNGQDTTYSGTLSGGNGLTKAGAGTLTVAAAQNYGGATIISGGVLKLGSPGPVTAGLAAWYDASTLAPGAVTSWNDLSGNGHTATDSGATGTPVMVANQVNGLPAVEFHGATLNASGTFFAKEHYYVFRSTDAAFANYSAVFGHQDDSRDSSYLFSSGATEFWGDQYPDAVSKNGTILSNPFNMGTINQYMILKIDVNNNNTSPVGYQLGGQANQWLANLDVAEILAYDHALTAGEEATVGGYLKGKYGITASYAALAPGSLPATTAVSMASSTTFNVNGANQTIASLADVAGPTPTGHEVLLAGGKLTIGDPANAASPTDTTFTGEISGVGTSEVEKVGTTTVQTLNGAQQYDTLTVTGGTLNVNGEVGTNPATGTASVTVADNAKLKFGSVSQTLSSLTIGAGATVTFTSGVASGAFSGGGGKGLNLGTAAVPEPGTLGLLLTGALGVLNRRRRHA